MKAAALIELDEPVFNFTQPIPPGTEVEIRLLLPATRLPALKVEFGFSDEQGSNLDVWYFDTPEMTLQRHGITLRTKAGADGEHESTVRLYGAELPTHKKKVDIDYHIDWNGKQQFHSYSFTTKTKAADTPENDMRKVSIETLFTEEQRDFTAEYATDLPGGIPWTKLKRFGPAHLCSWSDVSAPRLGRKIRVEHWKLRSRWRKCEMLDVSTKARSLTPHQATDIANDFFQLLAMQGFTGEPGAPLKPSKILQFFRPGL